MTDKPNRFERRKQQTRQQLKQAALKLLREKGYEQMTVQDITDTADLGRGTFYVHFKDKEEIVWSLLQEGIDQLRTRIGQIPSWYPPRQIVFLSWLTTFRFNQTNREIMALMMPGQSGAVLARQLYAYVSGYLAQRFEADPFYNLLRVPPEAAAQYQAGALIRSIEWWLGTEAPYSAEEMAVLFYRMTFGEAPDESWLEQPHG